MIQSLGSILLVKGVRSLIHLGYQRGNKEETPSQCASTNMGKMTSYNTWHLTARLGFGFCWKQELAQELEKYVCFQVR